MNWEKKTAKKKTGCRVWRGGEDFLLLCLIPLKTEYFISKTRCIYGVSSEPLLFVWKTISGVSHALNREPVWPASSPVQLFPHRGSRKGALGRGTQLRQRRGANDERQDYDPVVSSAVPPLPAHLWLICSLGIVICEAGIVSCCVQVWHNETLKWGCWCLVKANRERRRALDPILSVSPGAQSWTWSIKVLLVLKGHVIMVITFLYSLRKYFGAIMVLFPRLCMPSYDCCCSYKSGRFSV